VCGPGCSILDMSDATFGARRRSVRRALLWAAHCTRKWKTDSGRPAPHRSLFWAGAAPMNGVEVAAEWGRTHYLLKLLNRSEKRVCAHTIFWHGADTA
jgi:hypothetical protein